MRERFHVQLGEDRAELFVRVPLTQEDCDRLLAMVQGVIRLHGPQADRAERGVMRMNVDPEWLLRLAEKANGCITSVGGLVVAAGQVQGDVKELPPEAQMYFYSEERSDVAE